MRASGEFQIQWEADTVDAAYSKRELRVPEENQHNVFIR
jgi:hypothetical protein